MKIAETFRLDSTFSDENLQFIKQLGVDNVIASVDMAPGRPRFLPVKSPLRKGDYYRTEDLVALKTRAEANGVNLIGLSHTPYHRWDKLILGQASRDEQIENYHKTLRNMGEAGIPMLQYNWALEHGSTYANWRTSNSTPGRGNAKLVSFDYEEAKKVPVTELGVIEEEQLWENLFYFLKGVLPVAEEAGVRMAIHPADPQVPSLAGIARILRSVESYDRLFDGVPSKASTMTFCLGCFSQFLEPEQVYGAIRHFGRAGKIGHVHFRNVRGTAEKFEEVYPDEGKLDMLEALRTLKEVGFDLYLNADHTPHGVGDTDWGHRGKAYAIGYIKGLLHQL